MKAQRSRILWEIVEREFDVRVQRWAQSTLPPLIAQKRFEARQYQLAAERATHEAEELEAELAAMLDAP